VTERIDRAGVAATVSTPVGLVLSALLGVLAYQLVDAPVVLLAWTLLGVTAGYSISGSI
jgi:hypothetical protein